MCCAQIVAEGAVGLKTPPGKRTPKRQSVRLYVICVVVVVGWSGQILIAVGGVGVSAVCRSVSDMPIDESAVADMDESVGGGEAEFVKPLSEMEIKSASPAPNKKGKRGQKRPAEAAEEEEEGGAADSKPDVSGRYKKKGTGVGRPTSTLIELEQTTKKYRELIGKDATEASEDGRTSSPTCACLWLVCY